MFKYNTKSDLKDGRLVTPLYTTDDDIIICLDENGEEIELEFDDFDFDKTEDERYIIIDDSSDDIITEPEPDEDIITDEPNEDIIPDEPDEDIITEPEEPPVITDEPVIDSQTEIRKSGWVESESEKASIIYFSKYNIDNVKKVNIWKDIIL